MSEIITTQDMKPQCSDFGISPKQYNILGIPIARAIAKRSNIITEYESRGFIEKLKSKQLNTQTKLIIFPTIR